MAEQHGIGPPGRRRGDEIANGHRPEFAIQKPHLVAVVDERPSDREQAERWQVVIGYSAANGGMRQPQGYGQHDIARREPQAERGEE
jgi:hypothetical protein